MTARHLTIVATLTLLIGAMALSQDPGAIEFDHTFGGGTATLWQANLSGLNRALAAADYPELSRGVLLFGQTKTIGFRGGPRLGFSMTGGSTASYNDERIARLAFTFGGGLLEWGVSTEPDLGLALGLLLGGGYATLTLVDHEPTSFEDALLAPFRAKLDQWLYAIEPSLVAYGRPLPGITIRLRAGLLLTMGCKWKAEEIAYRYPMAAFSGPSAEVSIMVNLEEIIAEMLGDVEVGAPDQLSP